jgi:hypothetical protein
MWIRLAAVLMTATVFAADFSGKWQLLLSRSDFGKAKPPETQEMIVHQNGGRLDVETKLLDHRGVTSARYTLDTTGKAVSNTIRGVDTESTASWRGETLHVVSKASVQGAQVKTVDQWQYSGGAKELVIYRTASLPNGDFEQRYVYQKVAGKP